MRILVAGGAGFIGSNYVHYVLDHSDDEVVVLDKLTYAGNLANLADLAGNKRYRFVRGDIADPEAVSALMSETDAVVNFAAESHVDRSILDPSGFVTTDVFGVYVLLEAAKQVQIQRFVHVSTDEVYGAIPLGSAAETAQIRPRSPYAASKAGGELLVYAYHVTYGMPTLVTRGSNTFGPYQYPEKLIPVVITEALDHRPIPVYGNGQQQRDWLYVEDHCSGIDTVLRKGMPGEAYNVGGGNERFNLEIIEFLLDAVDRPRSLIQHVIDRPGHDIRYSVASDKLAALGWTPSQTLEKGLAHTARWYIENQDWWRSIKESRDYLEYYQKNYGARESLATERHQP